MLPSSLKHHLFSSFWFTRRYLGLTPMPRLVRALERRGVDFKQLRAIEVFGGRGSIQTADYADEVSSLEIWELDPRNEQALRKRFPGARIRITDSYRELQHTPNRFDLIVVDAPRYGGGHFEHFDVLPLILRIASPSALIVLNVIEDVGSGARDAANGPVAFEQHLAARARFYRTKAPARIPVHEMIPIYGEVLSAGGYALEWHFTQAKWGIHKYLALKIARVQASDSAGSVAGEGERAAAARREP